MTDLSLPLTTFEQFLLWEDRPAYPWSCFVRLRFSGRIDREALQSAVQSIMPRHPLLGSLLEIRGRRMFWKVQPDVLPETVWMTGPAGGSLPDAGYQDLQQEIGLKLFVVEDDDACDVTLQFHHACCDGAGILVFVNDLLIAYALARGAQSRRLRLPKFDPQRLAQRGTYGLTFWKLLKMMPKQMVGLQGAGQFLFRSPAPLLPHQALPDDDPPPAGFPATRTHTFSREETAALRDAAKRSNVTVNDLLARDVFLALGEWRSRHGAADDDAWLRMMVPVSLRSSGDRLLSAANVVSSVFLDRCGRDFADPEKLLAGIVDELQLIKNNKLGLTFIFSLRIFGLLPGGLKNNARADKCTVSTIFTNVGRPLLRCPLPKEDGRLVAGDVVLEGLDGTAPIRPYNCATFTATEYARHLALTLHFDPRPVSAAQADDLLATLARRVKTNAGSATALLRESQAHR